MSTLSADLERRMFKAVAGGYVFQPPSSTYFRNADAYLVNEFQKADILAIYRAVSAKWRPVVVRAALVLAVATDALLQNAEFEHRILLAVCVFIIAQIVGLKIVSCLRFRRLRRVLDSLPRSDERLFPRLNRPWIARRKDSTSPRWSVYHIHGTAEFMGIVDAPDEQTAIRKAIEKYEISDPVDQARLVASPVPSGPDAS